MTHFQPTLALGGVQILPSPVALFLTVSLVVFLFRRDFRERPNVTNALWIPLLWMLIIGSRSVVQWLNAFGIMRLGSAEEGNPLDALIFFTLILAGVGVLNQRRASLDEVFRNNKWLTAYLFYCFIAIIWSEYPFVAFKHWVKVLGHPVMVLVLFTEPDFGEALARLMKRSAYVLLPASILFIKYYPGIGRMFDDWGAVNNAGVCQNKNSLGCGCLIFGLFFFWQFLKTWRSPRTISRRNELRLLGGLLVMIAYLLRKAHDATATLCLLLAVAVILVMERRWVNKKLIGTYAILAIIALAAAQLTFGIFQRVVDLTGHNTTIAGRMELWRQLLALHTNPIFGVGFESFWLGGRLTLLREGRPWQPNEAHNGYLEIYLNLGLVGLIMLFGLIVVTFRKIRLALLRNFEWGRFRLSFLVAVVFYNFTEATFRGLSLTWFVFFIIAMDYPVAKYEPVVQSSETDTLEEAGQLTYLPE
jgi:exopolysaccharide production protein ExoQ